MSTLAMAGAPAAPAAAPPVRHCFGPITDFVLVGGLSIVVCAAIHAVVPRAQDSNAARWTFYWLAFLVNWPHFLISYQLLYWNYRRELFTRPRFIWAAWVAPGALIALLGGVALADSGWLAGLLVQSMFLLVGWHFVKQAYGCFVVLSARNRYFLSNSERRVMRAAMYALWILSFVATNIAVRTSNWNGVEYPLLWWWPTWLIPAATAATAITGAGVVVVLWRKARREGHTPPVNALVALASIYVWFIPALNHRVFFVMTPFFHSLQYLLFALLLTRNRAVAQAGPARSPWPELAVYLGSTVVLGAFFSTVLPTLLDRHANLGLAGAGPTFWLFAFVWFINVHHYFIDNKLWLRDNAEMAYLK